ncbi:hypothetical protein ACJRO7_002432 [Eucalyptus globulus]|uniref:Leucine-rich repeat-containing N-terminal plant-type domain-containing protein n=1 Tax=Eucalyptus globulus TaxID=34317 RepID=A0ABD3LY65_EUCGL
MFLARLPLLLLPLLSFFLCRPASAILCHPEDKEVLLRIKSSFNSPYILPSWDPNTDCCYCWLNLTGPIPSFLGQLKNLTQLDLSFNKLTGSIPDSLSTIPGLGYIGLDRNQLTGKIPASLANLKGNNLYLILSHNSLSGELPATFAGVDFGKLDLSRNRLQGDASLLFGGSKRTSDIDISRNQFEFDLSTVEFNESLWWLYLYMNHNKIYGSIPKAVAGLELQFLNVSYNRLCGEIPVGGRLQSFDYTAYFHNRCLCGAPLDSCK